LDRRRSQCGLLLDSALGDLDEGTGSQHQYLDTVAAVGDLCDSEIRRALSTVPAVRVLPQQAYKLWPKPYCPAVRYRILRLHFY
jgi:hypothetical protein